jgi:uncharacterized protein YggE
MRVIGSVGRHGGSGRRAAAARLPPLAARSPPPVPCSLQSGRLSVTGSATVSVSPDVAKVFLSVQVSKPTVKEACDTAAKTTAAVKEAVQKVAGVEVTTDNISVRQDVKWIDGQERFQGYICENSLKLKSVSRNSSQLGDTISSALDAAISAGGNYLTVSNMMTELSPELRATATNDARRGAVADAESTASILAEAAKVKLGAIKSIVDSNFAPAPVPLAFANTAEMAMAADAGGAMAKQSTPVTIGSADVTASVSIQYAIS